MTGRPAETAKRTIMRKTALGERTLQRPHGVRTVAKSCAVAGWGRGGGAAGRPLQIHPGDLDLFKVFVERWQLVQGFGSAMDSESVNQIQTKRAVEIAAMGIAPLE